MAFQIRSDTNSGCITTGDIARGLKSGNKKEEGMYYGMACTMYISSKQGGRIEIIVKLPDI